MHYPGCGLCSWSVVSLGVLTRFVYNLVSLKLRVPTASQRRYRTSFEPCFNFTEIVTAIYNRYAYVREMRRVLEVWANDLTARPASPQNPSAPRSERSRGFSGVFVSPIPGDNPVHKYSIKRELHYESISCATCSFFEQCLCASGCMRLRRRANRRELSNTNG